MLSVATAKKRTSGCGQTVVGISEKDELGEWGGGVNGRMQRWKGDVREELGREKGERGREREKMGRK